MSDRLPYILVGLFFITGCLHLLMFDSGEIDNKKVEDWEKYRLHRPDEIPELTDRMITHVRLHSFSQVGDVSVVIEMHQDEVFHKYKLRKLACSRGWYDRFNTSDSFEKAVGTGSDKRGSALYVKGADKDEQIEFEYICRKYVQ